MICGKAQGEHKETNSARVDTKNTNAVWVSVQRAGCEWVLIRHGHDLMFGQEECD